MRKRYTSDQPAPTTRIVRRPSRPATLESEVLVPLLQSIIAAALMALVVLIIAATVDLPRPLLWASAAGTTTAAIIWVVLLRQHQDLLWEVESTTGVDLDGNHIIGRPDVDAPEIPYIETTARSENGHHLRLGQIPLNKRNARAVATALHRGTKFTRRDLVAAGALPDDPEKYSEIYRALLQVGYLESSGNGAKLTPAGREFFEECLKPGW